MQEAGPILRARLVLVCAALIPALVPAADGAWRRSSEETEAARLPATSLDAGLSRARATLRALRARERALAVERATVAVRLQAVRRSHAVAQRRLATRLRALYEEDEAHPLEVVLGATSFRDAVTGLENLERVARQDRAWIERSRALRLRLTTLARALDARALELRVLRASAQATADSLARLQAEATRRDDDPLSPRASAAASVALVALKTMPSAAPRAGHRRVTVVSTAYTLPGSTATGAPVGYGIAAVDPAVIPLGSRLTVPGYGTAVAADTGPAIRGARIDVWFPTIEEAHAWGTRTVTVTITGG